MTIPICRHSFLLISVYVGMFWLKKEREPPLQNRLLCCGWRLCSVQTTYKQSYGVIFLLGLRGHVRCAHGCGHHVAGLCGTPCTAVELPGTMVKLKKTEPFKVCFACAGQVWMDRRRNARRPPSEGGSRGDFQHIYTHRRGHIYSPRWTYISTAVSIYSHHGEYICVVRI